MKHFEEMSNDTGDMEAIVRAIFHATTNKDELSVKTLKIQVSEKIGRALTKPETQSLKEIVCDLYQSYAESNQNVCEIRVFTVTRRNEVTNL